MANKDKVIKMHRFPSLNVGIVVFLIIIIYMAFNLISYLTSSPVAEYEVGQGTIATNHVYRGLILRDETVVYAGQSGYINYFIKNGQKVSVNDIVYSIDTQGDLSKKLLLLPKMEQVLLLSLFLKYRIKLICFTTHTIPIRILPYIH